MLCRSRADGGGEAVSRVGKMPIAVPNGVEVRIKRAHITVKGPKGELSRDLDPDKSTALARPALPATPPTPPPPPPPPHGLTRTLVQNMVTGVSEGFTKA